MDGLKIGQVAKQAQVNLQTIHYYERRELLPKPSRTASNYRLYPAEAVQRIRFIKRAQAKANDISKKLQALQGMRRALAKLIAECSGQGPVTQCPILQSLDAED